MGNGGIGPGRGCFVPRTGLDGGAPKTRVEKDVVIKVSVTTVAQS